MLSELRIENFAIITRLDLRFAPGLTVLTGETGAGKSIILDAIAALIGGKADASLLRAGAERALVEGEFTVPPHLQAEVNDILERENLPEEDHFLLLSREIRREGRSLARINGRSAAIGIVRDLGALLVDIHGQSEHLSLLNPRSHIHLLDRFAGCEAILEAYRADYRRLREIRQALDRERQSQSDAERRSDLLSYQIQEIDSAGLKTDEEDQLKGERNRLANAEGLASATEEALALLDEGAPDTPAISDLAGQAAALLMTVGKLDPEKQALAEQAEEIASLISDLSLELRNYREGIEFNPRRLEAVEDRLDLIHKLQRKYGATTAEVLAFAKQAREELENIANLSERIAELEASRVRVLAGLVTKAQKLSALRRAAAQRLDRAVEGELNSLNMDGARFETRFNPQDEAGLAQLEEQQLSADGADQVEFFIAPNPGEGLKPLVRTASGGETSRLMLALKNVLVSADSIPTLIFDEIDQGIGGRVGAVVGEKLAQIGKKHAVMCVTHLPQLAAYANQHLRVGKIIRDGRTSTDVQLLDENGRVEELAAMLGATNETNRRAAREALRNARANGTSQPAPPGADSS